MGFDQTNAFLAGATSRVLPLIRIQAVATLAPLTVAAVVGWAWALVEATEVKSLGCGGTGARCFVSALAQARILVLNGQSARHRSRTR